MDMIRYVASAAVAHLGEYEGIGIITTRDKTKTSTSSLGGGVLAQIM
jgi:hypothetical protein